MGEDQRCCSGKDEDEPRLGMIQETVEKTTKSIEMNVRLPVEINGAKQGHTISAASLLGPWARLHVIGPEPDP